MRRRRISVAIVVLLCAPALIAWRCMPRHDARLLGTWVLTQGPPPLDVAYAPDLRQDRIEWTFRDDGTGKQYKEQWVGGVKIFGGSAFKWRTRGDQVRIEWREPMHGWKAINVAWQNLLDDLRLTSGWPVERYTYTVAHQPQFGARQFTLRKLHGSGTTQNNMYHLTGIEDER